MFAKFYGMAPADYWRLSLTEYNALAEFIEDYAREMERASRA